jgi:hypothetical protein
MHAPHPSADKSRPWKRKVNRTPREFSGARQCAKHSPAPGIVNLLPPVFHHIRTPFLVGVALRWFRRVH